MLALLAMAQLTNGLDLAGHLRALGAPRAAQRLDGGPPPVAPTPFTVDSSKVHLVADAAAATAFSADVSNAAALALDCEWRPDGPGEDHAVALAQVATKSSVWLVDFVHLQNASLCAEKLDRSRVAPRPHDHAVWVEAAQARERPPPTTGTHHTTSITSGPPNRQFFLSNLRHAHRTALRPPLLLHVHGCCLSLVWSGARRRGLRRGAGV